MRQKYWESPVPSITVFGGTITDEFIDGSARFGDGRGNFRVSWTLMTPDEFEVYGQGLGAGLGQRYRRQMDGKWLKVEG